MIAEKLNAIAENTPKVFEAGYAKADDQWWDTIQNCGKRTNGQSMFFQFPWRVCAPKYPMTVGNASNMFDSNNNLEQVDWSKFDFTGATILYSAFSLCPKLTAVDTDLAVPGGTATLMNAIFRNCTGLQRVQKITAFPEAVWKNSFDGCTALTHVIFDGTIGANGLNLQWSTGLDKESITSVINALSDATTGLTVTLSSVAVNNAFYDEAQEGLGVEWNDLINTKENWTINLV